MKDMIKETKENIKKVRRDDLPESLQKFADVCSSIINYYHKNKTISEKQETALDKFNDNVNNYKFNAEIKISWENHRQIILDELDETVF